MDLNCILLYLYFHIFPVSFITFKPCVHLDGKHSIFGKVNEGLEILDRLENIKTDSKDKPLEDVIISEILVIKNPIRDAIAEILLKEWKEKSTKKKEEK